MFVLNQFIVMRALVIAALLVSVEACHDSMAAPDDGGAAKPTGHDDGEKNANDAKPRNGDADEAESADQPQFAESGLRIEPVKIRNRTFKLEVAASEDDIQHGLMEREKIADDGGMIFVFLDSRPRSFWMKNCLTDMDLLFLTEHGEIVRTHAMKMEPLRRENESEWEYESRLKRYDSAGRPARYAIELMPGTIEKLSIRPGQMIMLDHAKLRALARHGWLDEPLPEELQPATPKTEDEAADE